MKKHNLDKLDGDAGLFPLFGGLHLEQDFHDRLRPVTTVTQKSQVRQGLLRRPRFTFHFGQLVTCKKKSLKDHSEVMSF